MRNKSDCTIIGAIIDLESPLFSNGMNTECFQSCGQVLASQIFWYRSLMTVGVTGLSNLAGMVSTPGVFCLAVVSLPMWSLRQGQLFLSLYFSFLIMLRLGPFATWVQFFCMFSSVLDTLLVRHFFPLLVFDDAFICNQLCSDLFDLHSLHIVLFK